MPFLAWAHWRPGRPDHLTRQAPLLGVETPMFRIRDGEYLLVAGDRVDLRTSTSQRTDVRTEPDALTLC